MGPNATMTINIRVVGRQAMQQLNQVQQQVGRMGTAVGTAGKAGKELGGFFDMLNGSKLIRAGKNLQWVGRQLTFAFTLPLVAAGIALFKVNMNIERSMREVIKVYGDGTKSSEEYKKETDALRRSFELLSTRFGIHQEEVIDIAAAWASAGSAGSGLAQNVKATLEAMILGSIDAEEATKGLIAIQATWGLSTKKNQDGTTDLGNALATLNVIENQTGIRMEGLIEVLERAGGAGRVAGTDIRHLSAMAAALVPAAGTAAQAGNALKSIISSLVNPTKKVTEALGLLGINTLSDQWLGSGVTTKIELIAEKFQGLSSANQALISSVLAGKFQFNRFSVLMNDIASGTGYYAKALDASSDQVKSNAQYQKELNAVLESNPRRWEIMQNAIRNAMSKAIVPLLPLIFQAIGLFAKLAEWFGNLPESTRAWILLSLAVLAVVGPAAQLVATFAELFGLMKVMVKFVATQMTKILAPMIGKLAQFIETIMLKMIGTLFSMNSSAASAMTTTTTAAAAAQTTVATSAVTTTATTATAATAAVGTTAVTVTQAVMAVGAAATAASALAAGSIAAIGAAAPVIQATYLQLVAGVVAAATTGATLVEGVWVAAASSTALIGAQQVSALIAVTNGAFALVSGFAGELTAVTASTLAEIVGIASASATAAARRVGGTWVAASGGLIQTTIVTAEGIVTIWAYAAGEISALAGMALVPWVETTTAIVPFASAAAGGVVAIIATASAEIATFTAATTGFWLTNVGIITGAYSAEVLALPVVTEVAAQATVTVIEAFAIEAGVASAEAGTAVVAGFTLPVWAIPAAIAAVVAIVIMIIWHFRDDIWDAMKAIARGVTQLPGVFARMFQSLIDVVSRAIEIVVEWLSYLNPFARHSPSLVDNVRAGVATILEEYAKFNKIPGLIRSAIDALDNFNAVSAPGRRSLRQAQLSDIQGQISKNDPEAGKAAGGVIDQITALESVLPGLTQEIAAQGVVVAMWASRLRLAEETLRKAKDQLELSRDLLSDYNDQLDEAKSKLQDFANAPITGMKEYGDQLFENEQKQRELQLQLLEFEKAGMSLDKIRDKYAALNGEIEMLRGKQSELRMGGAGSDVLGVFDDAIAAIEGQQAAMSGTEQQIIDINKQLDELDLNHRFLELTCDITFEPLLRQIDEMVNGVQEMSFDDIVTGIKEQQRLIEEITPKQEAAAAAVKEQEAAVKAAQLQYDMINSHLDEEQTKLDALNSAFTDISGLISDMESAMSKFAADLKAAEDAAKDSALTDLFNAGLDANFEDFGADNILQPEGDVFDIEAFNKQLEEDLANALAGMEFSFDPFAQIKEMFDGFVTWIKEHWMIALAAAIAVAIGFAIGGPIGALIALAILGLVYVFMKYKDKIWEWTKKYIVEPIWDVLKWVGRGLKEVWDEYIYPVISWLVEHIGGFLVDAFNLARDAIQIGWQAISDAFSFAWGIIEPILGFIGDAITWLWEEIIKPIWDFIYEEIIQRLIPVFQLLWAMIEIVFTLIGRIFKWAWDEIIYPIFTNLDHWLGNVLTAAFQFFQGVVEGVWDAIQIAIGVAWTIIEPIFNLIMWIIEEVLAPVFTWLWHEVVEPVFSGIASAITWAWENLIQPAFRVIMAFINDVFLPVWEGIRDVIAGIWGGIMFVIGWVWDRIAGILEGGINFLITVFNTVADVVKGIADFLHIDVSIGHIEKVTLPRIAYGGSVPTGPGDNAAKPSAGAYATGGVVPAAGDVNARTRAIVGEGSNVWPEYVIPTDPRYRNNARALYADLGMRMFAAGGVAGHEDAPGGSSGVGGGVGGGGSGSWGGGGWWSEVLDIARAAGSAVKAGALWALWNPAKAIANGILDQIPMPFIKDTGKGILKMMDDWITGGEEAMSSASWQDSTGEGVDIKKAGSWHAILNLLENAGYHQGQDFKILRTFTAGARTRNTGALSWHALDRAIDIGALDFQAGVASKGASAAKLMHIAQTVYNNTIKSQLHELIWGQTSLAGGAYSNVFNGRDHNFDSRFLNEHLNHVHVSLGKGGRFYVPRTLGGVNMRVAEGASGEQIQVLPTDGSRGGGSEYHFHGDLVFPNVQNGNDAQAFIKNLEALATKVNGRN